jgi:hypothetical protein
MPGSDAVRNSDAAFLGPQESRLHLTAASDTLPAGETRRLRSQQEGVQKFKLHHYFYAALAVLAR